MPFINALTNDVFCLKATSSPVHIVLISQGDGVNSSGVSPISFPDTSFIVEIIPGKYGPNAIGNKFITFSSLFFNSTLLNSKSPSKSLTGLETENISDEQIAEFNNIVC